MVADGKGILGAAARHDRLSNPDRVMADGQLVGVRVERGDPGSFGPEPSIARRPTCHEQAEIR
jgi:hypothetical protein